MMAEPIGIASGILALSAFALKSSVKLHETVKSYKSQPKDVRDLLEELEALAGVLDTLTETAGSTSEIDLSALKKPLLRCGHACQEFQSEVSKCISHSSDGKSSLRDWARLKYIGGSIENFRNSLAGYKATINVALADVILRRSSATAEQLVHIRDLVQTATEDLEVHLQKVDDKVETILSYRDQPPGLDADEIQIVREERASIKKGLEICAQVSEHIRDAQNTLGKARAESATRDTIAENLTNKGLQGCIESLDEASIKLESYMKDVLDRLIDESKKAMSNGGVVTDLIRLTEEWETARHCKRICSFVGENLESKISEIENYATGDSIQFMVSTSGQTIRGKNKGMGWRNRQIGGHLSDQSVQQLSRDMSKHSLSHTNATDYKEDMVSDDVRTTQSASSEFDARHGPGIKLEDNGKAVQPLHSAEHKTHL